ncbi:hypothetical protein A4S06_05170 [Erysipelotrichaceae bacterium MTC7]|nr:hypothetical protein A4S06_05170 [Erysipelotrichaceae bacterium MTC7]
MGNYLIVSDVTADLHMDVIKTYDVKMIPMMFRLDEKEYQQEADFKVFHEIDFYNQLRNGSTGSTSQITPYTYIEYFTPLLEAGHDVLYIAFSSGLSNTYQSSLVALEELKESFPDRKIHFIDSLAASAGEGLMIYYACLNREKGMTIEENEAWLLDNRLHFAHWVAVDDLHHLARGGRVSGATAIVGSALSIKPILHVDDEGHLLNVAKARGRKKSLNKLVEKMKETAIDPQDQVIMISHADSLDDVKYLIDKIKTDVGVKDVIVSDIGPVVGSHAGPGTIALFFLAKTRS